MPHAITALITKDHFDNELAKSFDLPIFFENGFSIIALDSCHSQFWLKKLILVKEGSSFFGLLDVVHLDVILEISKQIGINTFALVSTEYHGGMGYQTACVFDKGIEIIKGELNLDNSNMGSGSINKALKYLGVKRTQKRDEFDTIGLGSYRSFVKYFDKYEKYCE